MVVIGGGDTGSDCVGTSNRHGAVSVTQFELLPKPPDGRTEYMPWPSYPMTLKVSSSHEEGCRQEMGSATKEFIGDDKGNLKALKISRPGMENRSRWQGGAVYRSSRQRKRNTLRTNVAGYGFCASPTAGPAGRTGGRTG